MIVRCSGLLLCLLLSLSAFADDKLLTYISKQADHIESMQGQFQQEKFLGVLPKPIVSSGRFEFSQQQGIVWQTIQPIQNTLTLSPGGSAGLQDRSQPQGAMVSDLFMRLLTGDFTQLQQWFAIQVNGERDAWSIQLTPLSEALATYIRMITIAGRRYSESIVIEEQNGDRSDISLQATSINGQQVSD